MTVEIPESVDAEGQVHAFFVPAIAVQTAPTAAEIAAGVDLSLFLMPDWDGPTATQSKGEDRRFGSKQTFQRLGRTAWEVAQLVYTYLPQAAPADPANEVYEALTEDTTGFLVMAYGIDIEDTIAVADKVKVFPITCGVQVEVARGADEFAPLTVQQELVITGLRQNGVVAA